MSAERPAAHRFQRLAGVGHTSAGTLVSIEDDPDDAGKDEAWWNAGLSGDVQPEWACKAVMLVEEDADAGPGSSTSEWGGSPPLPRVPTAACRLARRIQRGRLPPDVPPLPVVPRRRSAGPILLIIE